MNLEKCRNALDVWQPNDNPYGEQFLPGLLFDDLHQRLNDWTGETADLVHTSNGGRYGQRGGDLETAVEISHDFRFHGMLVRDWLSKIENVEAFVPLDFRNFDLNEKISLKNKQKIASVALANRVPLIICPPIAAREIGGESVTTTVDLPHSLLDGIDAFSTLLRSNRAVIFPAKETIDSQISEAADSYVFDEFRFADDRWGTFGPNSEAVGSFGLPVESYTSFQSRIPDFNFVDPSQATETFVEEHAEAYQRYLNAVATFQIKLQQATSENDVKLIFLELNEEYAALDDEYDRIQKKLSRSGIQVLCGMSATMVSLALPDSAELLKYVISTSTAYSGLKWLGDKKELEDDMKGSPYWFPWKLGKLSTT